MSIWLVIIALVLLVLLAYILGPLSFMLILGGLFIFGLFVFIMTYLYWYLFKREGN